MALRIQFRKLLPIAQTALAAFFGGWGLWLRNEYLSRYSPFGWNSTERFHVWPWPYRFAAVSNMPALLAGVRIAGDRWPRLSESVQSLPSLLLVPLLWYGMGSWLDRNWRTRDQAGNSAKAPLILVLLFTLASVVGASVAISNTTYLLYGIGLWLIVVLGLAASTVYRKLSSNPDSSPIGAAYFGS